MQKPRGENQSRCLGAESQQEGERAKGPGATQPEGVFAEQKGTEETEVELELLSRRGGSVGPIDLPGLGEGLTEPKSVPKMALTLTLTFTSASCLRAIDLGN